MKNGETEGAREGLSKEREFFISAEAVILVFFSWIDGPTKMASFAGRLRILFEYFESILNRERAGSWSMRKRGQKKGENWLTIGRASV